MYVEEIRIWTCCRSFCWKVCFMFCTLTFILLELKVISIYHQCGARPAFTTVQTDQALYCWMTNFLILISLKVVMSTPKNESWVILFKKFSRLRVNVPLNTVTSCHEPFIFYSRGSYVSVFTWCQYNWRLESEKGLSASILIYT